MRIVKLKKEDFDSFARKHPYRNFYQTSSYGEVMRLSGYDIDYIGAIDNKNQIIGASLILSKRAISNYKYAYAPRGFLIDYSDADFVLKFTEELRKFYYKEGYIYIKIDPMIHCSERNSDGTVKIYNRDINHILEVLKKANYIHHGFNTYFETEKPRWHAVTRLTTRNEKIYHNLSKRVRGILRKANNRGIEIYQDNNIEEFYEITKGHKKMLNYYKRLDKCFPNQVEFYFAKINTETYVKNLKDLCEKELIKNDELNDKIQDRNIEKTQKLINKKMESDKLLDTYRLELGKATKLLSKHPEGITIAAACILKHDKVVYLLKEGVLPKYRNLNALYLLKWEILKKVNNEGYQSFNLNAITGNFSKENKYQGLNESKLEFNARAIEYIGEFDYIINPSLYNLYKIKPKRQITNKKAE